MPYDSLRYSDLLAKLQTASIHAYNTRVCAHLRHICLRLHAQQPPAPVTSLLVSRCFIMHAESRKCLDSMADMRVRHKSPCKSCLRPIRIFSPPFSLSLSPLFFLSLFRRPRIPLAVPQIPGKRYSSASAVQRIISRGIAPAR